MSSILFCLFGCTQTLASQPDRSFQRPSFLRRGRERSRKSRMKAILLRNTQQRQNVFVQHFVTLNSS